MGELRGYSEPDLVRLVDTSLRAFSVSALRPLAGVQDGKVAGPLATLLRSRGKRIRPVFTLYGAALGGAGELTGALLKAATALELFHLFALIHDDIIDNAESRRGNPSLHRLYGEDLDDPPANTQADQRARNMAMLAGDLVLCWANVSFQEAIDGAASAKTARTLFDQMTTEIMVGQAMDMCHEGHFLNLTEETTAKIVEYKTARYTFLRPMQIGAALAGADAETIDSYHDFALPLGRAFQLRDDLIGAFDDGSEGKSGTTDLECGKPTELMRYAVANANPASVTKLLSVVGRPATDAASTAAAREILLESGAVKHITAEIEKSAEAAERALRGLRGEPWLEKRLSAHLKRLFVIPGVPQAVRTELENVI
ncbi:polyprenyl synthetase family protein [Amycolatopsis sp. QT-25]|uniref:polyprenyl synthetase family protein n=1 Tax=Amycolatopsis sp. QT-25 TaxID=3034022 RepID=UPI0023ECCECB|nr:polyprenyl synthetase family protein [Amycolatopsis sp. QT-25]WET80799.1 polyprenyl synthetase family protein [Amycolatopsis sp. QT-25]